MLHAAKWLLVASIPYPLQHKPAALSNVETSQLQDLIAIVTAVIQAESTQQTAAFQTEVANLT